MSLSRLEKRAWFGKGVCEMGWYAHWGLHREMEFDWGIISVDSLGDLSGKFRD